MKDLQMFDALMAMIMMVTMLFSTASSAKIVVGGTNGWDVSSNLASWSNSTSIYVNDTLQFFYTAPDNVIEVSEPDFSTCNTSSPIAAYMNMNGETLIILTNPGPRYFVSGSSNHYLLGLKLHVEVLLQHNTSSPNNPQKDSPNNDRIETLLGSIWWNLSLIFFVLLFGLDEEKQVKFFIMLMLFFVTIILVNLGIALFK